MASGIYKFVAAPGSQARFLARNRPSTDALNVLQRWCSGDAGRRYDKLEDTDDHIVARLFWNDQDDAGGSLHGLLLSLGLEAEYLGAEYQPAK